METEIGSVAGLSVSGSVDFFTSDSDDFEEQKRHFSDPGQKPKVRRARLNKHKHLSRSFGGFKNDYDKTRRLSTPGNKLRKYKRKYMQCTTIIRTSYYSYLGTIRYVCKNLYRIIFTIFNNRSTQQFLRGSILTAIKLWVKKRNYFESGPGKMLLY